MLVGVALGLGGSFGIALGLGGVLLICVGLERVYGVRKGLGEKRHKVREVMVAQEIEGEDTG